jgi:centromeric protein E
LAAFVSKFDSLGLGAMAPSKLRLPMPSVGGTLAAFTERRQNTDAEDYSPTKIEMSCVTGHLSLLDQMPEDEWSMIEDMSFDEKDFKAGSKLRPKNV